MSINADRKNGEYAAQCDICGSTLGTEYTFQAAVNARKDSGWVSRRQDGEWQDICAACWQEINNM